MLFEKVLREIILPFQAKHHCLALIGGHALSAHGVLRNTGDMDFLVLGEQSLPFRSHLENHQYECFRFDTYLSQYQSTLKPLGQIDCLHAVNPPSIKMLDDAKPFVFFEHYTIPVLQAEDLIALKLQSIRNDSNRYPGDMADIVALIENNKLTLNRQKILNYLGFLNMTKLKVEIENAFK